MLVGRCLRLPAVSLVALVFLALTLLGTTSTVAGTATLLRDITPGSDSTNFGERFVGVGGALYFTARAASGGYDLWKTDGTKAGTVIVKAFEGEPKWLVAFRGRLYFSGTDREHGRELWRSNGTTAGTKRVRDIRPGAASSEPTRLTAVGKRLFFAADDGVHGRELWKSTGWGPGTKLVRDIARGRTRHGEPRSSNPEWLVDAAGTLLFSARNKRYGRELWRSNGSRKGTRIVRDIGRGQTGSSTAGLAMIGRTAFFSAIDKTHGQELWKSDGTRRGTRLVKDLNPGPIWNSGISPPPVALITDVRGTAFYRCLYRKLGYELCKSDGTNRGTRLVKDIWAGGGSSELGSLASLRGKLLFFALDKAQGYGLWRSDGTLRGTRLLKDINPGTAGHATRSRVRLAYKVSMGRQVFFGAADGAHGFELWKSDGTVQGTKLAVDIVEGPEGSGAWPRAVFDHTLFLIVDDGIHGRELWTYAQ